MTDITLRVAAKAVITDSQGNVLLLREANTYGDGTNIGSYGIPGGRLNPGESYEDGLRREVKEETGLDIEPSHPIFVGEWRPIIKEIPHQIIAIFTVCKAKHKRVRLSEEHDDYKWVKPHAPGKISIMEPDDLVIQRLAQWFSQGITA